MKKVFVLLILSLLPAFIFAQVRKQVCIVRPNYSEEIKSELNDFIPRLKKLQLENPEEYIQNFIEKGSSGSGFIYVDQNGNNYVITNRHVIADAKTCNVVFYKEKGKNVVYKDLEILAANADLDLAILVFPDNKKPFESGLEFSDKELFDGDEVYTAGYPGLLGNPSWQFGSGIVTNESIEVEELIKPELSTLIQHSAQIDAGNSGGPLLVRTGKDSYKVAGINTWKMINRQDTNFSIPAETVKKFIDDTINGNVENEEHPEEQVKEIAIELHKVLNKFDVTFEEINRFISIDYIEKHGKAIFDNVINNCNDENRATLNKILKEYSPIEGMRWAISWHIFNEYHKYEYRITKEQKTSVDENKLPDVLPAEQIEGTDIWTTMLYNKMTKRCGKTEWLYLNGGWELSDFANVNANTDIKKSINESKNVNIIPEGKGTSIASTTFYKPNIIDISYGSFQRFIEKTYSYNHELNVDVSVIDLAAVTFNLTLAEPESFIYNYGEKIIPIYYVSPLLGAQFQLPIKGKHVMLMPYVGLKAGVKLYDFNDGIDVDILAAADAGSKFYVFFGKSNVAFFINADGRVLVKCNGFGLDDIELNLGIGLSF